MQGTSDAQPGLSIGPQSVRARLSFRELGPSDHRKGLSWRHGDTEMDETEIGTVIVDCAVTLHQGLGPAFLETVHEVTRIC